MAEHHIFCMDNCPDCPCLTCAKDDGAEGSCCIGHHKPCHWPCPDYEKEVEHGKT